MEHWSKFGKPAFSPHGLRSLRDHQAHARITARIRRLSLGNPGGVKSVGGRVSEMRIDHGPGYRVYFTRRGDADIARAIELARDG